jgi:phosphoribosylglycinamide formyltransferase-1
MRLAVLASHEGSTLQALIDACANGELDAQVVLVISNNSQAGALRRADAAGIEKRHISGTTHASQEEADHAMVAALSNANVDWVLLLGYMKKMGDEVLSQYSGRIINTHPALLPAFGGQGFFGRKVHEAVHAAGVQESGATLHLVGSEYDTGPIIAQVTVPVSVNDDIDAIEHRVKAAEKKLLLDTLKDIGNAKHIRPAKG